MISHDVIERCLLDTGVVSHVEVGGDGYHYTLTVVSEVFEGLSKVKRQQWVYSLLNALITTGSLHALSMKTYTNNEWETHHG